MSETLGLQGPPAVSLAKLPTTGPDLFGRDAELQILDDAWADPHTHIVAFIAFGGVGKSAVVNEWLRQMERDDYRGARRIFGWSFYSQGQREHAVSADQFIDETLRFFGDSDPASGNPWQRAERLAQLIRQQHTLLVFDGLEPMQSHAPGDFGKVTDPALQTLLCELSRGTNGLCLMTTRLEPADISLSDDGGPARRVDLSTLTPDAGVQLLRAVGVTGPQDEMREAVEDFAGHALALVLLAEYLTEFHAGAISHRSEVPLLDTEMEQGGHAWRVMQAYDIALKRDEREAERAILRIVGLFDRPASKPCIDALRAEPAIEGVTDAVVGLSSDEWNHCLARLRRLRLISPAPTDADALDSHPLVREYFGRKLQEESLDGFRQAHGRLYEYLRDHGKPTPDTDTDTLEDLMPLYQAVHHGSHARRYQEALDEIYRERIKRHEATFSLKRLGAFGADLSAFDNFFELRWQTPVSSLSDFHKAYVLSGAGFMLRSLGRLREAVRPIRLALQLGKTAASWEHAAIRASNLVELLFASGDLHHAASTAEQAVTLADRSRDSYQRLLNRAWRATTAHSLGCIADAARGFLAAEYIQQARQPRHPLLYSLPGAFYCWLLLDLEKASAVQERGAASLFIAQRYNWLLPTGLDYLSLGRASHLLAVAAADTRESERLQTDALTHLNSSVDTLRRAGQQDYLPYGLLARASFLRDFDDREQAGRDLQEALTLSERIGLRLHETDARLLQGHMALDEDPPALDPAQNSLARATELVTETGYHLRDADLLILEGRLLAKQGNEDAGRATLNEAITVARREEADGYVYRLAIDQANRYLKQL